MSAQALALFLWAVAQVETGGDATKVGARGEVGASQMSAASRQDHGSPEAHERWIEAQLRRRGVAVVPFNVALCWNAGVERALSGRAPLRAYEYARRVENLCEARRIAEQGRLP